MCVAKWCHIVVAVCIVGMNSCVSHTAKLVRVSDQELEIAKNCKWFNDDLVPRPFRRYKKNVEHNICTHISSAIQDL